MTPTTAALRAVMFDMDGLLVETESIWLQAEHATMAEIGAPDLWNAEHQQALVGGPLSRAGDYMATLAGRAGDGPVVEQILLRHMENLLRREPVHWMPGARELLTSVRDAGLPRALVSASYRPLMDAVLDAIRADVGNPFTTTVAAGETPRTKPFGDPYVEAARRMGTPPGHTIVLEDSDTGSRAGMAAGALVVVVPSLLPVAPAPGRVVAESLRGLDVAGLDALLVRHRAGVR